MSLVAPPELDTCPHRHRILDLSGCCQHRPLCLRDQLTTGAGQVGSSDAARTRTAHHLAARAVPAPAHRVPAAAARFGVGSAGVARGSSSAGELLAAEQPAARAKARVTQVRSTIVILSGYPARAQA